MPYVFYKVLHIIAIALVLGSLGGAVVIALGGSSYKEHPARKWIGISHGGGMLLILIAGFGAAAKLGMLNDGLPGWVIAKLLVWLLVGGLLAVAGKVEAAARALWFMIPALVGLAGWIAIAKPF